MTLTLAERFAVGSLYDVQADGEQGINVDADTQLQAGANMSPLRSRGQKKSNSVLCRFETWAECSEQEVQSLPPDTDGTKMYVIPSSREQMMGRTKDLRPWKMWSSSSCSGFKGTRRVARCKGCYECPSDFLQVHKVRN